MISLGMCIFYRSSLTSARLSYPLSITASWGRREYFDNKMARQKMKVYSKIDL